MYYFLVSLNAVLPLFWGMLLGILARRLKIVRDADAERLNLITFNLFMPALLFHNIYISDLSSAVRPGLILYSVLGIFASYGLGMIIASRIVGPGPKYGVVVQALFRTNPVLIGIPITNALLGNESSSAVAVLIAIVVPIFNILAVICLSSNQTGPAGTVPRKQMALGVLKNPLVISSAAGLLFLLLNLRLPGSVETTVKDMAGVASPLMLIALGSSFRLENVRKSLGILFTVAGLRLLLFPAIFLGIACLTGFSGVEFAALISVFASPVAMASYTMAQQMGGDPDLAGNLLIFTSILCPATLLLWCTLFQSLAVL